jgi:hypothetical protein
MNSATARRGDCSPNHPIQASLLIDETDLSDSAHGTAAE